MLGKKQREIDRLKKEIEELKEEEKTEKSMLVILDTNIPLTCAKFRKLEFLDRVEVEADVFIPCTVFRELMSSARMAEEDKQTLREIFENDDFDGYMSWKDELGKELTQQQVEAREARIEYAEDACSFVQEKLNSGKWKTIGTHNEFKERVAAFEEEIKEMVNNRRADLEILACCLIMAEKYEDKKIILMSRDRGLRNAAEKFGIRTHIGLRDKSSLFKK